MSYNRSAAKYLDPRMCGSIVGFSVSINEYTPKDKKTVYSIEASVSLSDCNRKIDWDFSSGDAGSIEKIDTAIAMLQKFRKELALAIKLKDQMNE